jgi:membrane protein YdbS with pleckstrin-like domain
MYDLAKETVLRLFRAPLGPPQTPSGEYTQVTIMRAAPRYLSYRLLGVFVVAGLLLALVVGSFAAGFFAPPLWGVTALLLVVLAPLLALSYFGVRVDYDLRYYVITDRSVRVRQGAWKVQEKTITFANVQNVRVEQGPLQRLFGFSSVRIDTAGGGMVQAGNHAVAMPHGVELAGIEDAAALRDAILAHVRRRVDGGLGDLDDRAGAAAGWSAARLQALREAAGAARELKTAAQLGAGPSALG